MTGNVGFTLYCLSILYLYEACNHGEFAQRQNAALRSCDMYLFYVTDVASSITCAALCRQKNGCVGFYYSFMTRSCYGCGLFGGDSYRTSLEADLIYFTQSVKAIKYVGCFEDCDSCALEPPFYYQYGSFKNMTQEVCSAHCPIYGSSFFGTVAKSFCRCGNENYDSIGESTTCIKTCSGNISQICGGDNAYSIYQQIFVC